MVAEVSLSEGTFFAWKGVLILNSRQVTGGSILPALSKHVPTTQLCDEGDRREQAKFVFHFLLLRPIVGRRESNSLKIHNFISPVLAPGVSTTSRLFEQVEVRLSSCTVQITSSMTYKTRRFNPTFTRALQ